MIRLETVYALFGVAFGFVFAAAGFNQYDVIHEMLLLENLEPFLVMGSAVMTAMPTLWLLERRKMHTPLGGHLELRRWSFERKHIAGGVVFGIGWAITGACPGTASTTLGGGSVMGIVLVVGIITGIALRDAVVARYVVQTSEPMPNVSSS
ncbi:MAG: YeeE/YedE family protein [Chloroflexia bacterium]|nr:YeeE/YedE family protein [Chloroflexia bacterium]MDQ3612951.1 YeeE/YedE family protein [Chloroflexota bacterium]